MSKQSEAKTAQAYQAKPIFPMCGNCIHFKSEEENKPGFMGTTWVKEVNLHCDIGGFAVKKQGTCKKHVPK